MKAGDTLNSKGLPRALTECDFLGLLFPDMVQIHPRPSCFQDNIVKQREEVYYAEHRAWDKLPSARFRKRAGMLREQTDFRIRVSNIGFN